MVPGSTTEKWEQKQRQREEENRFSGAWFSLMFSINKLYCVLGRGTRCALKNIRKQVSRNRAMKTDFVWTEASFSWWNATCGSSVHQLEESIRNLWEDWGEAVLPPRPVFASVPKFILLERAWRGTASVMRFSFWMHLLSIWRSHWKHNSYYSHALVTKKREC